MPINFGISFKESQKHTPLSFFRCPVCDVGFVKKVEAQRCMLRHDEE